jgi:hypothetical protein
MARANDAMGANGFENVVKHSFAIGWKRIAKNLA